MLLQGIIRSIEVNILVVLIIIQEKIKYNILLFDYYEGFQYQFLMPKDAVVL